MKTTSSSLNDSARTGGASVSDIVTRPGLKTLAAILLFGAAASVGHATDGTWESSSGAGYWDDSAKWVGGNIANGTDARATFNGTSGATITINGTQTLGNLTVTGYNATPGWRIQGGTLVLDSTSGKPTIYKAYLPGANADFLRIDSVISGSDGLSLNFNGGRLFLAGNNTFTGGVDLGYGTTLWMGSAAPLNGNTLTFGQSSIFSLGGTDQNYTSNFVVTGTDMRFIFNTSNTTTTLSGDISETGGAQMVRYTTDGAENVVVKPTGTNTFTGDTQIGAVHKWGSIILRAETAAALGGSTNIFFGAGTKDHDNDALQLANGVTFTGKKLTLRGRGNSQNGSLNSVSGNNTWAGEVDIGTWGNATIGVAADRLVVSGKVSGSGLNGLSKVGAGILELSGNNTFGNGTNIKAGTLLVSHNEALAGGNVTVGDGAGTDTLRIGADIALEVNTLDLSSSAHLAFNLTSNFTTTTIGVTGDQLGTGNYTVDIYDGGGLQNGNYTLMQVAGTSNAAGFTLGTLPGGHSGSSLNWDGTTLLLNVIPEPAVALLAGMGALTLLLRRRRE